MPLTDDAIPGHREYIVTFDARQSSRDKSVEWPPDRRRLYLISPQIESPRSVDVSCWKPVLENDDGTVAAFGLTAIHVQREGEFGGEQAAIAVPGWPCFSVLEHYLGWSSMQRHARIIAITRFLPEPFRLYRRYTCGSVAMSHLASSLSSEWDFIGYDVANHGLLSALMNCGLTDEEQGAMRMQWAPYINEYHLFGSASVAYDFAGNSDSRIPEHSPFHVYGIYVRTCY